METIESLKSQLQRERVRNELLKRAYNYGLSDPDVAADYLAESMEIGELNGKTIYTMRDKSGSRVPVTLDEAIERLVEERPVFKPDKSRKNQGGNTVRLTRKQMKDPAIYDKYRDKYLAGEIEIIDE